MAQVKIGAFKFGEEKFELRYVVNDNDKQVLFVGRDIAIVLKYEKPADAIAKHVDAKYKCVAESMGLQNKDPSFGENQGVGGEVTIKKGSPLYLQPHTILITKSGVIQLIMKSKLPYAVELQEWLLEEVIPQVLCTGKYTPAIDNGDDGDEKQALRLYKDFQAVVQKKDEQLQQLTARIQKMAEQKDQVIHRIMNDLNRMYSGFQSTMAKKDELMRQKDEQVSRLLDKMVDMSGRVVQYPANDKKLPMICIARNGNMFRAITGQRPYVERQKLKRLLDNDQIVVEAKRPNPTVDWNNAVHEVDTAYPKESVKRLKRALSFESSDDADKFSDTLHTMLAGTRTVDCIK
ncbi:BRO-C [Agrotis ipsilon multiple nucleopolyhedrovirus]|uniref:BRO-C n=1 Tax=Agrotis ipsilon multiple nucleopolyhedrovirus TaxID=208013 RepID=B6D5Z7_9ABAC|nr:BRO-C [Agrotis ipsilon multiple nucleopolyhedrovirus]ACI28785.1 BRO-C [Agrotis ipsilon multiple nucleopolyhedrovirus]